MRTIAFVILTLLATPSAFSQTPESDQERIQQQLNDLKAEVSALVKRQAASDSLLKSVAGFLQKLEEGRSGSSAGVRGPSSCDDGRQTSKTAFIQAAVKGCVGVSSTGKSITLTLLITNQTSEKLYLRAKCCYRDWLSVVDDVGRKWMASSLTTLPTEQDTNLLELEPSQEISITGQFEPTNTGAGATDPSTISIAGVLIRRTAAEQGKIDREGRVSNYDARPLTFGITGVSLRAPQ